MSNNKYEKIIEIDNKFKKIYRDFAEYQALKEVEQNFFDSIFPILWFEDKTNYKNKYYAQKFNYSESYIEKLIRKLSNNFLIYREFFKKKDDVTLCWTTERTISLDPTFKSRIAQALKLVPSTLKEDPVVKPEAEETEALEEEPEAPVENKKIISNKKSRFDFSKVKK